MQQEYVDYQNNNTENNDSSSDKDVSFNRDRNQQKFIIKENVDIEVIKISNDVMKNIQTTEKYADFFGAKYSGYSYKNFLNNLIEYKYNLTQLQSILRDINLKNDSKSASGGNQIENENKDFLNKTSGMDNRVNVKNYKITNNGDNKEPYNSSFKNYHNDIINYQSNPANAKQVNENYIESSNEAQQPNYLSRKKTSDGDSKKHIDTIDCDPNNKRPNSNEKINTNKEINRSYENPNFEKLLRSCNKNNTIKNKKKPFNRFTKLHGNFFEKNIHKKNNLFSTNKDNAGDEFASYDILEYNSARNK